MAADMIVPGAFARSLGQGKHGAVRMLYQHDLTRPIGCWKSLRETPDGLWVEGILTDNMRLSSDVAALLRSGALDGLSIGFRVRRALSGKGRVRRVLIDLELVEISIVTFPMQPFARVSHVTTKPALADVNASTNPKKRIPSYE